MGVRCEGASVTGGEGETCRGKEKNEVEGVRRRRRVKTYNSIFLVFLVSLPPQPSSSSRWSIRFLPLWPMEPVPSDIEVARAQTPKHISELAREIGLRESEVRWGQ